MTSLAGLGRRSRDEAETRNCPLSFLLFSSLSSPPRSPPGSCFPWAGLLEGSGAGAREDAAAKVTRRARCLPLVVKVCSGARGVPAGRSAAPRCPAGLPGAGGAGRVGRAGASRAAFIALSPSKAAAAKVAAAALELPSRAVEGGERGGCSEQCPGGWPGEEGREGAALRALRPRAAAGA